MEWNDEGLILAKRRHAETAAIVDVLTATRGRWTGLVRGGRSRAMRPVLQAGNLVKVRWRARIEDHLGTFTIEPIALKAGELMADPLRLAGLGTLTALLQLLPEREAHPRLYEASRIILDALTDWDAWPALLVRWELGLLDEIGFGLDLSRCAATGSPDDLIYVSPKTGRAVSASAGAPYRERLLSLPGFLCGSQAGPSGPEDILAGFRLTGYFLDRHVFGPRGLTAPEQRHWITDRLAQTSH
ncbi:DNA repair protein RecO [soil metagenome]